MIKKLIMLTLCLSASMFLMTGCTLEVTGDISENEIEATEEPIEEEIPAGPDYNATLNLSMRKPATLNPLLNEDITVDSILKLMFMQVMELDENMRPVLKLAEDINYASDGSNVLITLRELNWSDGEPVKADDLIFSINTLKSAPETVIYKENVSNILTATAVDERTVKLVYTHAFAASDYLLCFPVIPQHYYKNEVKADSEKNLAPLGNYVYKFDSYDGREHLLLSLNEAYPNDEPYIKGVDVLITSDAQTDLNAYDRSLVDVLGTRLSDWGKYRGTKQTKIYEYVTTYYDFIGFNFNNPALSDVRLRRAIAYSIDLDKTTEDIYHSNAVRTNTPISPQSWLYEGDVPVYGYDPGAAKELFERSRMPEVTEPAVDELTDAEASAEDEAEPAEVIETEPVEEENTASDTETDSEAVAEEELNLVIIVNEENEERVKVAEALAEAVNGIGIGSTVEVLPFDEYEARLYSRQYDIFVGGINFSEMPDLSFLFHSANAGTGMNFFDYKNDRMDMLLAHSFSYTTQNSYRNAMSELQKYIAEDLPVISICFRKSVLLTDQKVYGDINPRQSNIFFGIEDWYIN